MRIGMMLRAYDEKGGVGVYARNLVKELLKINQQDQFYFYYWTSANIGKFADRTNVTEQVIHAPNKALWDQVAIPMACKRDQIDIIFHPKFTVPLLAPCKAVMVVHGADWFVPEQAQYYNRIDIAYIRAIMPLYFKKCARVISVSELTTQNFYQVLKLPRDKIKTIYFGPAKHFKPVQDASRLQEIQRRYKLPEQYILTLTKRKGDGRKNLRQIIAAYARYHQRAPDPRPLVIGGKDCHLFRDEYGIPKEGYGKDIFFPGWIEQEDMPVVYTKASLFLYPSNLEAFPIPITEAMACGTPIITSNVNGLVEIAGDAALLVDPNNAQEIADAIQALVADHNLQAELSRKGVQRAKIFSWDRCASQTMQTLRELMK